VKLADLPPRDPTLRALVVCCAVSVAVHASLLLSSGERRSSTAILDGGWSDLRIALVDAFRTDEPPARSSEPLTPLPRIDRARLYPRLLPFSPADLPPPRFDENAYLPLAKLTVPPTAAREIEIAYPNDSGRVELLVASLTLFIDEDGTVAKVRAEAPHAPAAYERAAIEAFSKARFNPGRIGQSAVKTRMVIRVAFDSGSGIGRNSSAGIRFR